MATTTTNYGFTLPDKTDYYDITQYNDTVTEIDELLEIAQENYESAILAASEAVTASANAVAAAETAETQSDIAVTAAAEAKTAAAEALTYYEDTQTLSIANVGDVTFSINAAKNCLTVYVASDDDVDVDDWYSEFLALLSEYAATAQTNANSASDSATLAESWAVGGTGTRDDEDTDNAKYYAEQASTSATTASTSAASATLSADTATTAASTATTAASSAQTYYKATQQLSVANLGEITLSINEVKDCLTATYNEDSDDDDSETVTVDGEVSDELIDAEIAKFE